MVTELIGRKVGMTQVYDKAGKLLAVTVIEVGPCQALQIKTRDKDGYEAVQVGWGTKKAKNTSKAEMAHFAKAGAGPMRVVAEVRAADGETVEVGQVFKADQFSAGDYVDVVGRTKGRGTTGVMKRWNFAGAPMTHGHKKIHRHGGSARPIKGRRMAGVYGDERCTIKNLRVVRVDAEQNLMLVSGAIPGHRNAVVRVRKASSPPTSKAVQA